MVEPVSASALLYSTLAGAGAAAASGALSKSGGGATPALPNVPNPILPAQQPSTAKPKTAGMQQSFLSGAASAQLPGASAGGGNKTLLGS